MDMSENNKTLKTFDKSFISGYQMLLPKGDTTIHQKALLTVWLMAVLYYVILTVISKRSEAKEKGILPSPSRPANEKESLITVQVDQPSKSHVRSAVELKDALSSTIIVGLIMFYFFVCDYLHYFPKSDRTYNRDLFMFLCFLLFAISIYYTTRKSSSAALLNRDQTEEWKGWMQVMFVWYHYFRATETYNAVRIYIAAYVWMTGFGNFSFFWVRKDYSLRRILKMLFRLNFLVILTTLVVDNSYMLYYICAMHTFWFLSVYMMMRPYHEYNNNRKVMALKFTIYFCIVFAVFDISGVANFVFQPFSLILTYEGSLHEWIFRSGLDHYATFIGMLCAYNYPHFEKFLKKVDNHRRRYFILLGISCIFITVSIVWYISVFRLPKYNYNALHPYTSFIPILTYVFLRNLTPWLRSRYVHLFTILGKITLETYISQLHIYLQSDAKDLLVYIAGYPLMSFVLNSIVYLFLSNLLFHGTVTINEYLFPNDLKKMWKNFVLIALAFTVAYALVHAVTLF